VKTENVALLESESDGISRYVEKIRERLPAEINEFGCIVMNANPFTNGHQYLVDTASRQCRHLLIFPVIEDRSVFPYEVRLQLIKENIRPYENISLLDGSDYIISAASFPTYFLKENSDISRIQAELDLTLFGSRIAAPLRITQRFVGTEPYDLMTADYNAQMKKILPMYGVQPIIIPRLEIEGKAVSASQIRKMLYENDFSLIEKFVPPATYHFLISDEAIPIIQKIKQKNYEQTAS
jgi:[citrate (pro-3S)-lyase] ligase